MGAIQVASDSRQHDGPQASGKDHFWYADVKLDAAVSARVEPGVKEIKGSCRQRIKRDVAPERWVPDCDSPPVIRDM